MPELSPTRPPWLLLCFLIVFLFSLFFLSTHIINEVWVCYIEGYYLPLPVIVLRVSYGTRMQMTRCPSFGEMNVPWASLFSQCWAKLYMCGELRQLQLLLCEICHLLGILMFVVSFATIHSVTFAGKVVKRSRTLGNSVLIRGSAPIQREWHEHWDLKEQAIPC